MDLVTPDKKLEGAHNQQGRRTKSGAGFRRRWRDATAGGWFSYDMKVLPDQPVCVMVTYWGGDTDNRTFDILIDGQKVATQKLDRPLERIRGACGPPCPPHSPRRPTSPSARPRRRDSTSYPYAEPPPPRGVDAMTIWDRVP